MSGTSSPIHLPLERMAFLQERVYFYVVTLTPCCVYEILTILVFYNMVRLEVDLVLRYSVSLEMKSSAARIPAFKSTMGVNLLLIKGMPGYFLHTSSGDMKAKLSFP